ncbi:hypothetical protein AB4624_07725 [Vibrio breoganii]|nr:conserved hypothetical protein [Vibrio crassostreae]
MSDSADYASYINYIATGLSIIGGIIAIWQAGKAISGASEAKQYRDEIVNVRQAVDFSEIEAILTKSIHSISKFGPSALPSSLSGATPEKDAQEIQYFITVLKRNKVLFGDDYAVVDKFCIELSDLIEQLVNCSPNDTQSLKKCGTTIYHRLTDFSSIIKGNLDLIQEARKPKN